MERKSTNENFEHFLRQNAEEFKMHPSPKVWDGISENLNKRKKRFYFGLIALLVSSSLAGYILLDFSNFKIAKPTPAVSNPASLPGTTKPGTNQIQPGETNSSINII